MSSRFLCVFHSELSALCGKDASVSRTPESFVSGTGPGVSKVLSKCVQRGEEAGSWHIARGTWEGSLWGFWEMMGALGRKCRSTSGGGVCVVVWS